MLSALAAALGYALAAVPNVELISLAVFVSGAALGRVRGAIVGLIGMGIYSGLGPYGSGLAIPPMFAGQLGAMALVGFAGGLMGRFWSERPRLPGVATAAAAGFVLTCVYQAAVVCGYAVASPEFADGFLAALTANLFFPYVHIVWNTVVFAVLVPLLVPRVRSLSGATAVVLVLAITLLAAPLCDTAAAQDATLPEWAREAAEREREAAGLVDEDGVAIERTVAMPGSLGFERWSAPLRVRHRIDLVQGAEYDAASLFGSLPGLRAVSSRWPGQRASLTRGGLPAALSTISVDGVGGDDWMLGGLGLLDATTAGEHVLVPSGPDLSTASLFASGAVSASPGGASLGSGAGTGAAAIAFHSGRRYAGTPFSRVGMASGDVGLRWRTVEFGTGLAGRGGLTGTFERRDGRASAPGGEYERETFRLTTALELSGDWRVRISGHRVTGSRSVPEESGGSGARLSISQGSLDLVLTDGATRIGLTHVGTRLADARRGDAASCSTGRTGTVVVLPTRLGPIDLVRAEATGLSAAGELLTRGLHAVSLGASVEGAVSIGGWEARFAAGATRQREETVPEFSCLVSHGGDSSGPWLSVDGGGRFPTALELVGAERAVVGADGARLVGGFDGLGAERAATLGLGWAFRSGRLDGGVAGDVSRVSSPVVLTEDDGVLRPASGDDATSTTLAFWIAAADTALGGARVSGEVIGLDEEGPLNALAPVPAASVDASVWLDRSFFKRTLDVRFSYAVVYETGLARGTWEGSLEDALWRTQLRVAGAVGPAQLLVVVHDPLDTDSGGWPGFAFSEPRVTFSFLWDFWN